jgi:hypothetical protein
MGGGLLQLTIEGQMNIPLFYNPRISFFSYAYKKHTNFAIENIKLDFDNSSPVSISLMHNGGGVTALLTDDPNVDLLSNLYFVFKVPDIYSDDKLKFKWVENFGSLIIKKAEILIDDNTIDTITGEWIIVWNELSMPVKDGFNNMTGNIPDLLNPRKKETTIRIRNNIVSEYDYASSTSSAEPSIKGRYISIPLPFWFTKNPSLSLPILKFCRKHKLKVKIEFEDIENLYTVYSDIFNMNISPRYYNELYNKKISFANFIKRGEDIFNAQIEATYIVLDCYERQTIIDKANMEFLIETVKIIPADKFTSSGYDSIQLIKVDTQLLVKEIIWTLNRADSINKFNNICNYSYSIPSNNENSIMKSATIIWDKASGTPRVEEKDAYFYNNIQPYQHHSIIPRQGIYSYSFSIFPEKWFPSGCFNGAGIGTKLALKLNAYAPSLIDELYFKKKNKIYKINEDNNDIVITVYIVQYNILGIISGDIGLKYQN